MGPAQAIRTCFRNGEDRPKRASRSEFWWFSLFLMIVSVPLGFLAVFLDGFFFGSPALSFSFHFSVAPDSPPESKIKFSLGIAGFLLFLPVVLLWLRAARRRLHDCDRSGWWMGLIPLSIIAALIVFIGILPIGAFGGFSSIMLPLPIISCAVSIIMAMLLWPSYPGSNSYGPNPLEVTK